MSKRRKFCPHCKMPYEPAKVFGGGIKYFADHPDDCPMHPDNAVRSIGSGMRAVAKEFAKKE